MTRFKKTAVIADDETHLRQYLIQLLEKLWPELEVVAEAKNGAEALALIDSLKPDIAFLDIKMPGLTGLQVAQQVSNAVQVVFITAYDEYAVTAFKQAAIDYLLKPVDETRLMLTIERLNAVSSVEDEFKRLADVLRTLPATQQPKPAYLGWIRAGLGDVTHIVDVADIVYFQADQKYVTVRTLESSYLIRRSLKDLEQELDPNLFWRVHRSTLVRVAGIEQAKKDFRGRFTLSLKGLRQTIKVSDSYTHRFRQM